MPIPLSYRKGFLQTPTAQPGKTIDPSSAIIQAGQVAANSFKLASEATQNMGAAIQLLERQREDIIAKEAILNYDKAITDANTELSKRQGLAAEEYRKNEFKKAIDKAQSDFDNQMKSLNYSDIRNNAVDSNVKTRINTDANADNYAYKEMISARNTMSDDLKESYKRQAKTTIGDIYSPDENMRKRAEENQQAMLENIKDETLNNANLNGLLDENYQKLKLQEAIDDFHTTMAEELSHPYGGFEPAEQYLKDNKDNMTTAAWDKAYADLDEDKLVYAIMKRPQDFIRNDGTYDERLAESIAPHLNDRERYRILGNAASASRKGSGMSAEDVLQADRFARRYYFDAVSRFHEVGIDINDPTAQKGGRKKSESEWDKELDKRFKGSTVSDIFEQLYYGVHVPANSKIVIRRSDGAKMDLAADPHEREKQLAAYMMDPNTYVVQNLTALSPAEAADVDQTIHFQVDKKSMSDGLGRGWVTRAKYNTFDGIGEYLSQEKGIRNSTVMDVWKYMLDHKNESVPVKDDKGKIIGYRRLYPNLARYDFFEQGAYDRLYKSGNKEITGDIQRLLTDALNDPNILASHDIDNVLYMPPGRVVAGSLVQFIQRQEALERRARGDNNTLKIAVEAQHGLR